MQIQVQHPKYTTVTLGVSTGTQVQITCDCWDSGLVKYSGGSSAEPEEGALVSAFLRGGERDGWLVKRGIREDKQPFKSKENMALQTPQSLQTA